MGGGKVCDETTQANILGAKHFKYYPIHEHNKNYASK